MYILDDSVEEKIRKIIDKEEFSLDQLDVIEKAARKAAGLPEK